MNSCPSFRRDVLTREHAECGDQAGTISLKWGAQAAGLLCLAARQTLRPTNIRITEQCAKNSVNQVFGRPPKTAREPRTLPFELDRSG